MADVFTIYEALWKRATDEGALVLFFCLPGSDGFFDSVEPVQINICRHGYKDQFVLTRDARPGFPEPDLLRECITFAHEYGHFRSCKGETPKDEHRLYTIARKRWENIQAIARLDAADDDGVVRLDKIELNNRQRAATQAKLKPDCQQRILHEEQLGWTIGRRVLAELGFDEWAAYDKKERLGLHNYRYRLGMEELWPGDE